LAINFSAVQSTTSVYTVNGLRSSHIIKAAHGSWPFYYRNTRLCLWFLVLRSKSKMKQQWDIWW
jgi:hypothetical protein